MTICSGFGYVFATVRVLLAIALALLPIACGADPPTASGGGADAAVDGSADTSQPSDVPEAPDTSAPDADSIPDIEEPVDLEPDAGDDIELDPDVSDVPDVEDVPEDTGPPVLPPAIPEGVMFRVNWVKVITPSFFLTNQDGEVVDISVAINAYLGSHLTTSEEPMDIVGLFDPFDFDPAVDVTMAFGRGDCERDANGDIIQCGFYDVPTFFEGTDMQPPFACTSFESSDACYTTTEASLSLDLAGVPLGFDEAFTSGRFHLDDPGAPTAIDGAFVQGFMDEPTAQDTTIYVPGFGMLVLADLLDPAEMVEKDGALGWWFEVDYKAVPVPTQ